MIRSRLSLTAGKMWRPREANFHCLRIGIGSYVWAQPFGDHSLPKLEHHLAAIGG